MQFIEVEDLMSVKAQNVIKSQSAKVDAKLEALEKEERDLPIENVTEEEREKTIKCLMKVLDYQLKGVKEQADEIEIHYKRVD